jgi:hypothetical protein
MIEKGRGNGNLYRRVRTRRNPLVTRPWCSETDTGIQFVVIIIRSLYIVVDRDRSCYVI